MKSGYVILKLCNVFSLYAFKKGHNEWKIFIQCDKRVLMYTCFLPDEEIILIILQAYIFAFEKTLCNQNHLIYTFGQTYWLKLV